MDLQEIKRQYFRIRVRENDDISIKINDVDYEVVDIGDHGIGIRLTPEDIFVAVDDKLSIVLTIKGVIHKLEGKVVHISPSGPEEILCGIDLIDLERQSREKLLEYLRASKEKIFK